ncbi:MAG: MFS transporter [Deltaproteobacteria bacterium]|jgi:MFS family permease|nr:MFS transporter [Deltaproteobacteria bacterium]MBT4087199.1 MFS transporter [Deltaproteobacteria bacterium]MBT4642406.1 MFS transporter [Deltaproteobacteria bacterium]MBT6504839.1 MFS transporter [Deltaproteobacteria bacterium]MBT6614868.1 MFS transporter [Deltaproteobacteria bacterium]
MNQTASTKTPLFFYGWVIIGIGFINLAIAFGIWYSFSVFFLAIIKDFGWSRAVTSSIFSIFIICHATMGVLTGHLQDRFGPRWVIPFGSVLLAAALILTSRAQELWHFYLAYSFFASIGVSLIGFTSHSAFLPNWFERKRGLAVGIAMSGIGFGMLVLVPILEKIITFYSWRTAYLCAAAAVLFLVAPLNLLFARKSPAEMNLSPDGDSSHKKSEGVTPKRAIEILDRDWAGRDWTLFKAMGKKQFWFLTSAFFCISFAYQSTLMHSVSAMVDGGLTQQTATLFFGILGIAGSGGKILFGFLSDIYGREQISTAGGAIAALGIACLITAGSGNIVLPLLFALLFGIGYGSAAPLLPSVSADIFSGRAFGVIFAMIGIGGGLGGSCGAFVSGLIRDMSDDYSISLSMSIVSLAISCTLIWLAGPGKIRKTVRIKRPQQTGSVVSTDSKR